ncbi:hypothetical protein A9264_03840 [Vibrio sp. UCD-FRSSP16_10]|uniref:glycosyltransferase family 52 n=1 Tax=unclassified Vibrio TaxID=2614977 RepID=UPI0007FE3F7D|nr:MULTISPECIES: glycosyltransferase family 52 [unclassified Vibrio]OBT10101.1 hypothetical protein A9260_05290 [Vibrio sp. UCD-FRSSP16_30]OBT18891.1 hypothetical protein A9264_03840 [Vibrio sp. UCD-FRSSP16_10]
MQLYICSTLRHLLFSISKSIVDNEASQIIFLVDHQNIDSSNLNFSELPNHIKVHSVSRKKIAQNIKSDFMGKIIYFFSMREMRINNYMKEKLTAKLVSSINGLDIDAVEELYTFNERNKTARLFRLLFEEYRIIEDGLANYAKLPLPFLKMIGNIVQGNLSNKRISGDDSNCLYIYAIQPQKLPKEIKNKGKDIYFLNNKSVFTTIETVFNLESLPSTYVILATQPIIGYLERLSIPTDFHMEIYKQIIAFYSKKNINVIVKPHPQESKESYDILSEHSRVISEQTPLEAYLIGKNKDITIVSLFSSAGMGFEEYCTRKTLIDDDEVKHINERLKLWHSSSDALDSIIIDKLS